VVLQALVHHYEEHRHKEDRQDGRGEHAADHPVPMSFWLPAPGAGRSASGETAGDEGIEVIRNGAQAHPRPRSAPPPSPSGPFLSCPPRTHDQNGVLAERPMVASRPTGNKCR